MAVGAAVGGGSAAMKSEVSWRKKEGLIIVSRLARPRFTGFGFDGFQALKVLAGDS